MRSARHDERAGPPLSGFVAAVAAMVPVTILGRVLFGVTQLADVVMLYLLAIVLVSLRWGLWPSMLAAVLSVLALDFFFIPPFHTLLVSDLNHVTTFAVMFLVAVVISGLTRRVRDQARAARARELRTASLYSLSGALARAKTTEDVVAAAVSQVDHVFASEAAVLLDEDAAPPRGLSIPLDASGSRVGLLVLQLPEGDPLDDDERQHLDAFARQIAGSLERTRFAERAQEAQVRVETEQLRNALLSSVSHDLRTPLAVITGAASTLLAEKVDGPTRRELGETIVSEAMRLNRLVRNLLDMTRLEAGKIEVKKEWQPLEETIGVALERVESVLDGRRVTTELPDDIPLVPYDSILLQQVLVNLLENAVRHTPAGTPIAISAHVPDAGQVIVEVADRGPGLPAGEEEKVFAKFYRVGDALGGGLGLTICRAIVTAHGGRIWAERREGGGAAFRFTLPIEGSPPSIDLERAPEESAFR